jgi:hypothetical protein
MRTGHIHSNSVTFIHAEPGLFDSETMPFSIEKGRLETAVAVAGPETDALLE